MKRITLTVEDFVYEFYKKISEQAGGIPVEQVIADSLLISKSVVKIVQLFRIEERRFCLLIYPLWDFIMQNRKSVSTSLLIRAA